MRCGGVVAVAVAASLVAGSIDAHTRHRPHRPRVRQPSAPAPPASTGVFAPAATIALPGRGLSLAWSPDGERIAAGGRFREASTGLRYDTRIADVATATLVRSYACHYFWVIATTWTQNPFLGEVIADGGGDHAVKLWDPAGPGSTTCKPGQTRPQDGALRALYEVNGWTTALRFSPDGRFVAGASRDRMVRVWQVAPGAGQFQVVGVVYDRTAGNLTSVEWMPDGRGLVTGDRRGRAVAWDFDPDRDRFDDARRAEFATLSYEAQPGWCGDHPAFASHAARWTDAGHGAVWNVRVAPSGDRVAVIGTDGTVGVVGALDGAVAWRKPIGTPLHALDWSADGGMLAVGGGDRRVYVLDAATGESVDVLVGHADLVSAVAWGPDGRSLASTAGGPRISLTLLDTSTGPDQSIRLWTRR
jgi:WD40 repeat protein